MVQHFQNILKTLALMVGFVVCFGVSGWGQSYLGLDGGFEGSATIDNTNLYSAGQSGKWAKANTNQTIADETTIVRSGSHALNVTNSTTTGRRTYTPTFSPISGQRLVIQFYRRVSSTTNTQLSHCEISRDGTTALMAAPGTTYTVPPTADTWEKVSFAPTSTDYVSTVWADIIHKQTGTGGLLYIDDVCIYTATAVDVTAANAPTAFTATPAANSIDVSWTAASGGVDGGGYLVVRGTSDPTTAPNVNGIYAVNNTIAAGMTIVYQGTGTAFTDAGLLSGTTYFYRIYTYDKAYNYSAALTGSATTGGVPTITVGSLTAFSDQCAGTISSEKTYNVSGAYLTNNIIITPPANFEISLTSGSGFVANPSSLTLIPSGGTVPSTTIYVVFKPTAVTAYSGDITHTSTGATQKNVAVSGNGISTPAATTAGTHTPSPTQIVWNWNTVSGASYKYNTVNDYGSATDNGSSTTYTQTSLTCNTSYNLYVWTYNSCGNSSSVTLTQTTSVCPATPIYQHLFGTVAISGKPYTVAPDVLNSNLNTSSWTTSYTGFVDYTGSSGKALGVAAASSGTTYTLTFNVASGYQVSVTSFSFWRQRSATGPTDWSMTINGTSVGSGTNPETGANTGDLTPTSTISGLTGTITVVMTLTNGTGGTFRLDDFTLFGDVTSVGPLLSVSSLTAFGDKCIGSTYGPNSFTITGTSLTTANVTVAALSGYTYCTTSGGTYTSSLSLPQGGGSYSQTIYVKFSPVAVLSYNGNISVGGGGASAVNCAASGSGVNSSSVTSHPSNQNVADGSNTSFTVVATNAASYQWQENQSGSWNNLSNGGVYSNVTTATMNITGVTLGLSGYQYRCVVTSSCSGSVTSNAATLTVTSGPTWLIDEDFTTTTGPGDLATSTTGPFTSSGTWFTASVTVANRGTNALFMSNDGVLTTPTFSNGDLLAFWMQCATGNETAYLIIEVNDGTKGWSTLATVTNIKFQGQYYFYTISTGIIQVRFNFFDGNNNDVYFDDVMIRSAGRCTSTSLLEKVHVNSCAAAEEGTNEFILVDVDAPINVDDLIVTFPSADPNTLSFCTDCDKTFVPNPTYTASINTLAGCAIAYEPPGGVIPANSKLVVFSGSTPEFTYDLSGACGSGITYYVLYCDNTNTSGRFANAPTAGTYRYTSIIDASSGCYDQVIYDSSIPNVDGEFAYYDLSTRAMSYGNNGCTEAILPIELLTFDAVFNNDEVYLSWTTATETNNEYFEIERSDNMVTFYPIGKVLGAGNSNSATSYYFTDYNPVLGNNYYRLKQTDFDGKSSESDIVSVMVDENSVIGMFLENNVLIISTKATIKSVDIISVTGKNISKHTNFTDQEEIQIDISGISAGIYFVKISDDSFTETRKIFFR